MYHSFEFSIPVSFFTALVAKEAVYLNISKFVVPFRGIFQIYQKAKVWLFLPKDSIAIFPPWLGLLPPPPRAKCEFKMLSYGPPLPTSPFLIHPLHSLDQRANTHTHIHTLSHTHSYIHPELGTFGIFSFFQ